MGVGLPLLIFPCPASQLKETKASNWLWGINQVKGSFLQNFVSNLKSWVLLPLWWVHVIMGASERSLTAVSFLLSCDNGNLRQGRSEKFNFYNFVQRRSLQDLQANTEEKACGTWKNKYVSKIKGRINKGRLWPKSPGLEKGKELGKVLA